MKKMNWNVHTKLLHLQQKTIIQDVKVANPQYISAGYQQFTVNIEYINNKCFINNYLTPNAIVTAYRTTQHLQTTWLMLS